MIAATESSRKSPFCLVDPWQSTHLESIIGLILVAKKLDGNFAAAVLTTGVVAAAGLTGTTGAGGTTGLTGSGGSGGVVAETTGSGSGGVVAGVDGVGVTGAGVDGLAGAGADGVAGAGTGVAGTAARGDGVSAPSRAAKLGGVAGMTGAAGAGASVTTGGGLTAERAGDSGWPHACTSDWVARASDGPRAWLSGISLMPTRVIKNATTSAIRYPMIKLRWPLVRGTTTRPASCGAGFRENSRWERACRFR